ncbi:hypothetical protein PoB_000923400 [Plakobranchus ocellatus]|uniref:Secreted protein n=1 Tax=Plakobranchus ocellatus TaxID=259542 RepID=A0AAV3YKS9_9GAST|nr:hypothetical protein PoB_000923400 [Plakobranchus ocellatus]
MAPQFVPASFCRIVVLSRTLMATSSMWRLRHSRGSSDTLWYLGMPSHLRDSPPTWISRSFCSTGLLTEGGVRSLTRVYPHLPAFAEALERSKVAIVASVAL